MSKLHVQLARKIMAGVVMCGLRRSTETSTFEKKFEQCPEVSWPPVNALAVFGLLGEGGG